MTLYEQWMKKAYDEKGNIIKSHWDSYIPAEQKVYEGILENRTELIEGSPAELAERFDMPPEDICGFIDGINETQPEPIKTEELTDETPIRLVIDFEKLYKKMVEYKAEHLYTLTQWNHIFTPERQKELYWEQKRSRTIVRDQKIGRNDPCPCGSGKKYKRCCGAV